MRLFDPASRPAASGGPVSGRFGLLWALLLGLLVPACAGTTLSDTGLKSGPEAYRVIPAADSSTVRDYRIGPLDTLEITVFQEPDLSRTAQVDAGGNISLALVGTVHAAGRTAQQLSAEIVRLYADRYLRRPQVNVAVTESVSQRVSVEGQVTQPGVYDFRGQMTLLQALALARGETSVAALRQVVVFRNIDGQRTGALFDVNAIRRGQADDPELLGNDLVVVGYSSLRGAWRDILTAAPLFNLFTRF